MSEVNKGVILDAIRLAHSMHVLKFLGDVLRVHKVNKMQHTNDKQFMSDCRDSYKLRHKFLFERETQQDGIRQREVGSIVQEQSQGKGHAPRIQGVVPDRGQGALDLRVAQEEQDG